MYSRLIRNDLKNSKAVTAITVGFVAAAALLAALAAILIVNLAGSIDTLMKQAKTPHFMQMHSGEIDTGQIAEFADGHENVESWQVLEFLNIEGASITIGTNSLSESVQDNGFSVQSEQFDYLLDLDGNVIQPQQGELYVPIAYMKDGTAKIGDTAVICGVTFEVAGFLRDSQMNSLLSTSKRFLVHEEDYRKIVESGSLEYLIEFRLYDLDKISAFENDFIAAGIEANGPTLTYSLFQLVNAMSDGIMIAVILLVSILVVIIAFLCIRFTLLARMEEDYREIGVMKAIGLRISDIKKIYRAKYSVITAAGCILGYLLSYGVRGVLLENIRLYMGESENAWLASLIGVLGIIIVFGVIQLYVSVVLRRFRKVSAANAVRFGAAQDNNGTGKWLRLSKNKVFNTNVFLGIKDVVCRKRIYLTMLIILILSAFIIIVPQNLKNTINDEGFIGYMGIGRCDIRVDLQQTGQIAAKADLITQTMEQDSEVENYTLFINKSFEIRMEDGSSERIRVELGDHTQFPINYLEGTMPTADDEIAFSSLNAEELEKGVGDTVVIKTEQGEQTMTVSGIYSDITNGGKTAKAAFQDNSAEVMWYTICAKLTDQSDVETVVNRYVDSFTYAKVSDISQFMDQMFGGTIEMVELATGIAFLAALLITILITLLFMKMLVAKDKYHIAVMKAYGFTNRDIQMQYLARTVLVLVVGVILGTLLANTLGERIAGSALASYGAVAFQFEINPLSAYLLCPLAMACAVVIATIIGTAGIQKIKVSENMKE